MSGEPAVVGIAGHNGWAILVSVAARDGVPWVLDRRRVELVDEGLPNQPYHHEAVQLDPVDAKALIANVKQSASLHSHEALSELCDDLEPRHRLVSIAVRKGPTPPIPEAVVEVLKSYKATCAADGELYRRAICDAATELGIDVALYPRRSEIGNAALVLGTNEEQAAAFLTAVGRELGPPWRKDHRSAAASAIAVLGQRVRFDGIDF